MIELQPAQLAIEEMFRGQGCCFASHQAGQYNRPTRKVI
jgi:hypothetical protein